MVPRDEAIKKIDVFLEKLLSPLSNDDRKGGWGEDAKKAFQTFFMELKGKIWKGERIGDIHISRRMDSWGVVEGPLLEFAEKIGQDVENLEKA